ncbi:DUF4132 domain-containing protein [Actinomadura rifamycini]|uniref:DUF4132 domain-containing protein n=1 Tax=Actinomadura rifamycini TaxID=31962 RepID=UPI000406CCB6|nr:DUF4132 domain-containing protein [Actinomadura rifamycini]
MTDEDTLVMPDAWRAAVHPRRGGHVPEPPPPDGAVERARAVLDSVREGVRQVVDHPDTAPDIAAAARAHLGGEPNALGAAAVVFAAVHAGDRADLFFPSSSEDEFDDEFEDEFGEESVEALLADALAAEHGVAFAAHAFTEMADIVLAGSERDGLYGAGHRPAVAMYPSEGFSRKAARSLRWRLAAAPDDVYADAAERLEGARRHDWQRMVAAYLVPTREDWVEDLCASSPDFPERFYHTEEWMLFCSFGRPRQLAAMGSRPGRLFDEQVFATLIDVLGPADTVPLLVQALDSRSSGARVPLEFLPLLPVDAAFQALVSRLGRPGVRDPLRDAARRFPERAVRLLSAASSRLAADVLAEHVRAHPAAAERAAADLPAARRAAVRSMLARRPAPADLPPLLTAPPWTRAATARPPAVRGLAAPGARGVAWAPGERDAWLAGVPESWHRTDVHFPAVAANWPPGGYPVRGPDEFLAVGPEDLLRPLMEGWEPANVSRAATWLPALVARLELDACDPALHLARRNPDAFGRYVLPLRTDGIARTMADWLVRLRTSGRTARAWFRRHGAAAAPSLVPDALGAPGPARRAAEHALRFVAAHDGPEAVVEASRAHGDRAAAAVGALLAADPLDDLPKKLPDVAWVDLGVLPQILLRDREHALPDDAARHVLTVLAVSRLDDPYAGAAVVREICDPESLAEFGWALFRHWEFAGAPSKENWALTQLAVTGDDETARRLAPVIRAWPGDGGHAKAVLGLDVLTAIGTETALANLYSISQRVKFKGLRARAQDRIEQLAADLELTADQLADRLVPDFGLDASGTLTLDYGPRRFVIGFDELLRPTVADEDGEPRKSLPKPGTADDPELAAAARKRFAALKKDVRAVAADQIGRLEAAMVSRRRWRAAEFREHLAGHPLVGNLARRLVWLAETGADDGAEGGGAVAFRVTEDGTFADAADEGVALPDGAAVRVAHPVDLAGSLPVWRALFADYEILQPFEQLARPVHALTADERAGGRLARFEGRRAEVAAVLGLARRGWERGAPMEVGFERWISRPLPGGPHLVVTLDPGFPVGGLDEREDQTLVDVRLAGAPYEYPKGSPDPDLRFGDVDPVTASEIITDLVHLTREPR